MTSSTSLSGTSYDLLAIQHRARTSATPAKVADTNISAASQRGNGSSLSMGLDATGNVITSESAGKNGKKSSSAAIDLFG
ncbi:hypothetical protein [Acetobacter conturbans]|uniref:Uncharacterized protein n=1 Tax=Acetobacter conturbans TaxID=1737472 RepID=A0ABX0K0X6_9PROT|nr:hypothetical protein [Acetobacter conturbans]NHN88330.1 hypothetical protein [Acetobacter conturbans]